MKNSTNFSRLNERCKEGRMHEPRQIRLNIESIDGTKPSPSMSAQWWDNMKKKADPETAPSVGGIVFEGLFQNFTPFEIEMIWLVILERTVSTNSKIIL